MLPVGLLRQQVHHGRPASSPPVSTQGLSRCFFESQFWALVFVGCAPVPKWARLNAPSPTGEGAFQVHVSTKSGKNSARRALFEPLTAQVLSKGSISRKTGQLRYRGTPCPVHPTSHSLSLLSLTHSHSFPPTASLLHPEFSSTARIFQLGCTFTPFRLGIHHNLAVSMLSKALIGDVLQVVPSPLDCGEAHDALTGAEDAGRP